MNAQSSGTAAGEGRVARLRAAVIEKVRWRLGFYQDRMLPPLPPEGVSTGRGARLRPYVAADIPEYAALMQSAGAETAQFSSFGDHPDRWLAEVQRRVAQGLTPYELAIVLDGAAGEEFAGAFYLSRVLDRPDAVEVGFLLAPAALGKGIGPRIGRAVVRWLIDAGVHRVETRHDIENTIACRAANGVGMKQEGVSVAAYPIQVGAATVWHDVCDHALVNPAHQRATQPAT
jgi:RimJ/RimL family protein N-acetyltransferase